MALGNRAEITSPPPYYTLRLYPEDRGSKVVRNGGVIQQRYTASQPRRSRRESSSPWISHHLSVSFSELKKDRRKS